MTGTTENSGTRILVVHGTPLVAEDLREALLSAGAAHVQTVTKLPETPPAERFDTCFLSIGRDGMAEPGLLERAARIATHVVLIIGFVQPKSALPPRFSVLTEPFRDKDVVAAIQASRKPGGGAPV